MNKKSKAKTLPLVEQPGQLRRLCGQLQRADRIAIDTEFIPEKTLIPELCLLQIATDEVEAVVDTMAFSDAELKDLWMLLTRSSCEIVVHAGKAEMVFLQAFSGRLPGRVVDVQLTAGLLGYQYPLSYTKLVREVLGLRLGSAQTRTDWRRRPLSADQLRYALEDVHYLLRIRDKLIKRSRRLGRLEWVKEETVRWLDNTSSPSNKGELWQRISGAGKLHGQDLAVLQELALWRQNRAEYLNKPLKRVMADDLLVELTRCRPLSFDDLARNRRLSQFAGLGWVTGIFEAVDRGLHIPQQRWPRRKRRDSVDGEDLLIRLLRAALGQIANDVKVAEGLLGTKDDLKALIDWHNQGKPKGHEPALVRGWRADICGRPLVDVLDGKVALSVDQEEGRFCIVFEE